ncbi:MULTISPECIES: phosphoenolpyruvate synthase [Pelosinus]|uniref:Rifampicin phosphotransferase n=1 Tax=Pelosinus fermentans B4 TaxID=1149862 RepID=I9LGZ6_9FIRM|nr:MULTISPECIES: phosphoenolpyruvate synthase [Pelosinus]EIW19774.1 pyruvate phosphate dikinase PEP/pyruvate-binding protein [Pelosinus fermentans B4]EIW21369.1 pyruvate phosphate dikinase PEP/pyruvate-binding protein [Pelosinus fermentans A11]OAM94928.1 Pyruvate, water dikinase [Pelosinus fermentans DSM 17108]SDR20534.1 pyruvate, water dikinase [Pelosinus fermentans]
MNQYVLGFREIDKTKLAVVGGKGANLGELSRIDGIRVPEGFCVTTEAYKRTIGQTSEFDALLDQLAQLRADERQRIAEISGEIRRIIEAIPIAGEIEEEIIRYIAKLGEETAYAVRSSATAEDLPNASFAGQQDTYLNIIGREAILKHISKCWASLFTDRAVTYRIQNGFDHRKVHLSVVIQKMVFPQAAGILFTADPVTFNRQVLSIDASFGLGEALVSGLVNADIYKVREGRIVDKKISAKKLAIYALKEGGTEEKEIAPEKQNTQTLTDEQILQLEGMGRRIEAYFGRPQDIEWCLYEDSFYIVQSRPITTLYPVPGAKDGKNHVYFSFGHRQMMTEAMKPLGYSFFQDFFKLISGSAMIELGGRLYIDMSRELSLPIIGKNLAKSMGVVDVLMQKAVYNILKRKDFIKGLSREKGMMLGVSVWLKWGIDTLKTYLRNDHDIVKNLMAHNEMVMHDLEQRIAKVSGDELFDVIFKSYADIKDAVFAGYGAVFTGAYASSWINKNIQKWLGEKNAADALAQSVPDNVTSEMGLELLDVADVVRKYPAVLAYFAHASDETFFADLAQLEGGQAVSASIRAYLKKYGMRCSAEIDITRSRWNEKPTTLIPMILSNIKAFRPGAHDMKFEQGLEEARQQEEDILKRLEQLPGGKSKVKKTKRMISVLRNFAGYREYSKYLLVWYLWIVKQALLKEADNLVQKGVIRASEDIYYLSFTELRETVRTGRLDSSIIAKRKEDYEIFKKLTPPRVITSEGEIISSEYDIGSIPSGALAGVAVSSGIIEGRARVIFNMEDANIEEGDILVTTFTDPSWTPVFVAIKGLVTEVGGMMTHGAVVAREYGLPAVVSVENATRLIKDGQRIRVNGTEGYVEIL